MELKLKNCKTLAKAENGYKQKPLAKARGNSIQKIIQVNF